MNTITENEAYELFDDFLDEINPEIIINGLTYMPSDVLKNTDPVAYRCHFSDWIDSEQENFIVEGY